MYIPDILVIALQYKLSAKERSILLELWAKHFDDTRGDLLLGEFQKFFNHCPTAVQMAFKSYLEPKEDTGTFENFAIDEQTGGDVDIQTGDANVYVEVDDE